MALVGDLVRRLVAPLDRFLAPVRQSWGWGPPTVREPYAGAWQANVEIKSETALSYFAVYACVTLISSDIGKLRLRLVQQDADGIWSETTNPAYSPVLRKPNRYQTTVKFLEQWITSKLVHGNTYVLKQRDERGVVNALYILDPTRVTPLVATDGSVYYQLRRDDLSGVLGPDSPESVIVPAREIIHDLMVALFHPLIGVTPLYACGLAALQGLTIQQKSNQFFSTGSRPSGLLIAPGKMDDPTAARMKERWEAGFSGVNVGRVAILSEGLKYEPLTITAVDAQLVEQLKWTAETICAAYHVPPYMVQIGPPPPYANVEPLVQQYYSQCLQTLITSLETSLDEGLELIRPYGTELDIDDLIWMDTATRTKAAHESISAGALSQNEARRKYFAVGPVAGGSSPYLQQQYYSLAALATRDLQASAPPTPPPAVPPVDEEDDETVDVVETLVALERHAVAGGLYGADV